VSSGFVHICQVSKKYFHLLSGRRQLKFGNIDLNRSVKKFILYTNVAMLMLSNEASSSWFAKRLVVFGKICQWSLADGRVCPNCPTVYPQLCRLLCGLDRYSRYLGLMASFRRVHLPQLLVLVKSNISPTFSCTGYPCWR
ncbi:unnamed protein product, partial [Allacma fusca]